MSGIVVGVAALIATLAVGRGSRDAVEHKLQNMGRDAIYVNPKWAPADSLGRRKYYRLTMADWRALSLLNDVRWVVPLVWNREQVIYRSADTNPTVLGITPDFLEIFGWRVESGRCFGTNEESQGLDVAMLGKGVADNLFGGVDPLEKTIRIRNVPFTVIGVMEARGADGVAQDNSVLIPVATAQLKLEHRPNVDQIIAVPTRPEKLEAVAEEIVRVLGDRNNAWVQPGKAFEARTSMERLKSSMETSRTFAILIFLTASLSLLVGGIGIMNTMMMAVHERTREIGIRMSMGATGSDILWLFILESLILSGVGGALGITAGTQLAFSIAQWVQWPPVVSLGSILLSFFCATAVGLVSGLYPAWRASRLEPVECLRGD